MNSCFFCGPTENLLTKEHVWPRWVSRALAGKYDSSHFVNVRSTGDNTTGVWKSRDIEVTTKAVCSECNNKWLSRFENSKIKPLASPLLRGDDNLVLAPREQWKLAAWAYKMAMLLEIAVPLDERQPLFFTPTERKQFRDTTLAHERVRVFLAKYDYGQHPAHAQLACHTLTERGGPRRSFDLKISTITAGALGMQVMAVRSVESGELVYASEIEFEFLGKAKQSIVRIWPPNSDAIRWPPDQTMSQRDIEDWTEMWQAAASVLSQRY
jgi:hypothetical protein